MVGHEANRGQSAALMSDFPPPKILDWWDARVLDHQRQRWLTVDQAVDRHLSNIFSSQFVRRWHGKRQLSDIEEDATDPVSAS